MYYILDHHHILWNVSPALGFHTALQMFFNSVPKFTPSPFLPDSPVLAPYTIYSSPINIYFILLFQRDYNVLLIIFMPNLLASMDYSVVIIYLAANI